MENTRVTRDSFIGSSLLDEILDACCAFHAESRDDLLPVQMGKNGQPRSTSIKRKDCPDLKYCGKWGRVTEVTIDNGDTVADEQRDDHQPLTILCRCSKEIKSKGR